MIQTAFSEAIDDALAQAMAADDRIVILGEDVHTLRLNLFARFGSRRVRPTPISESAFLGAAVTAAMGGLRPVVEIMLVDFLGVAMDALLNHAAKIVTFSGGRWNAPLVVRASCGGGYGDGGQHEQSLWGWLAHIPGLSVVAPAFPADAGAMMLGALAHPGPVVFLEHKLLSEVWLDYMGGASRESVRFDVPPAGARGPAPNVWEALEPGRAEVRVEGRDMCFLAVGVGVHRALEAAEQLKQEGIAAGVLDLRSISPLDTAAVCHQARKTGRLVVVDEDYRSFGLSGEIAAVILESGLAAKYGRVCTEGTIPYARKLEDRILPNTGRLVEAARCLLQDSSHRS